MGHQQTGINEVRNLTKEEAAWVRKVQRLLNNPPSDRLGFYTIGDNDVTVYDSSLQAEIDARYDQMEGDFGNAVEDCGAFLGVLNFPNNVHSTAG
jgi:hypothetical protein